MSEYLRRKDSGTWHWCRNCSNWPIGPDIEKRDSKPTFGGLCI